MRNHRLTEAKKCHVSCLRTEFDTKGETSLRVSRLGGLGTCFVSYLAHRSRRDPYPPPSFASDFWSPWFQSTLTSVRRSNWAFNATIMVLADMNTAPTAGGMSNPHGTRIPAAIGTITML